MSSIPTNLTSTHPLQTLPTVPLQHIPTASQQPLPLVWLVSSSPRLASDSSVSTPEVAPFALPVPEIYKTHCTKPILAYVSGIVADTATSFIVIVDVPDIIQKQLQKDVYGVLLWDLVEYLTRVSIDPRVQRGTAILNVAWKNLLAIGKWAHGIFVAMSDCKTKMWLQIIAYMGIHVALKTGTIVTVCGYQSGLFVVRIVGRLEVIHVAESDFAKETDEGGNEIGLQFRLV